MFKDRNAAKNAGKRGGRAGGPARAASLTPERRKEIARKAIAARWEKARADKSQQTKNS